MTSANASGGLGARLSRISFGAVWEIVKHPSLIPVRFSRISRSSIPEIVRFVFAGADEPAVEAYRKDFLLNHRFFTEINTRYVEKRGRRTSFDGWFELLYVLVRFARPAVVVETGIFDGHSSAVILQALCDNGAGELISIDLPAYDAIPFSTSRMEETSLPSGEKPGWVIPDNLRSRHRLILGDAKEYLSKVLEEAKTIDVFLHDSLHTFEHQWFEYSAAWPHLSREGILLSDDVFWNTAYHRFCRSRRVPYMVHRGLGVAKKI